MIWMLYFKLISFILFFNISLRVNLQRATNIKDLHVWMERKKKRERNSVNFDFYILKLLIYPS